MSGVAKPLVRALRWQKATLAHLDFSVSRREWPRPLDPLVIRIATIESQPREHNTTKTLQAGRSLGQTAKERNHELTTE
jgi:hypothetical protein